MGFRHTRAPVRSRRGAREHIDLLIRSCLLTRPHRSKTVCEERADWTLAFASPARSRDVAVTCDSVVTRQPALTRLDDLLVVSGGTSLSAGRISVSTVLARVPLRELPLARPPGPWLS